MPGYNRRATFRVFGKTELREYLALREGRLKAKIEAESENYILNVNETDYINHLVEQFSVSPLVIDFDAAFATDYEAQIPAERFNSFEWNGTAGKTYPKDIYVFHLPFSGNEDLLQCMPSNRLLWGVDVFIEGQAVCFEVLSLRQSADEVNREFADVTDKLKQQLDNVTPEVAQYNARLPYTAKNIFQARKQKFLDKNNVRAALKVPLKRRDDLPQTFAIPTPQVVKKFQIRPVVTENGYKADPTLDTETYSAILQTLHDLGKEMERLPSIYAGKEEENLRDLFLLYLTPRIQGEVTGETFNKTGKTDILIRYENHNVFVAECKFWKGQKGYLETITQLLGYLTWRDSKAAVIMFVENKEFSSVLATVEAETPNHSNYLGFVDKKDESWLNYRFHTSGDRNREIKLAVLLFHLPK